MACRVKHASSSHDVRARLVAGAVWPKVLYGLEITFMRREATTAILEEYHQTNPFLACNTIAKFMIDPQYYVIEKLLLTIRRWYLRQPTKVLDWVNTFRGNKACGPISSCALHLRLMNMQIDGQGDVTTPGYAKLCLFDKGRTQIKSWMQNVWDGYVQPHITRRGANFLLTKQIFSRMPATVKKMSALRITGTISSGATKQKWGEKYRADNCPFCEELETMEHTLLHCEALQHQRDG